MIDRKFSRQCRLLTPGDYGNVFNQVQIKAPSRHIMLLARFNGLNHPRLGLVISKKKVRRATDRNTCKRMLREAFRCNQHRLPAIDIVAVARMGLADLSKKELMQLYTSQLFKLAKRSSYPKTGNSNKS